MRCEYKSESSKNTGYSCNHSARAELSKYLVRENAEGRHLTEFEWIGPLLPQGEHTACLHTAQFGGRLHPLWPGQQRRGMPPAVARRSRRTIRRTGARRSSRCVRLRHSASAAAAAVVVVAVASDPRKPRSGGMVGVRQVLPTRLVCTRVGDPCEYIELRIPARPDHYRTGG